MSTVEVVPTIDVMQKAVCLILRIGSIGNSRKVSASQIETDADRDMIRVSKTLFDTDELKNIQSLDGEIRRFVMTRGLPSLFRSGAYLIPNLLVTEVDNRLKEYYLKRKELVEKFMEVYPAQVEIAKSRLGSLFDPRDYPMAEEVRASFTVDWQYVNMGIPGNLEGINADIFRREQEKQAERWQETMDEVQQVLRGAMSELVTHLVTRLTPDEEGKQKIFRNSLLENMRDFLNTFDARNITNDEELAKLVQKARDLTEGIDPDVLRKNSVIRDVVRKGFEQIKSSVDTMIVNKPRRIIE